MGEGVGAGATHVLVWPWSPAAVRAEAVPSLLPAEFLLPQLNEALTRTALLLQPLQLPHGVRAPITHCGRKCNDVCGFAYVTHPIYHLCIHRLACLAYPQN